MLHTKKSPLPWLAAGILISLLVMLVVSGGLAGKVWIVDSEGIPEAADTLMNSIRTGDWETLNGMVSGNPRITPETGNSDSTENRIWNAYQNSLQWICADSYELDGAHVTQKITVTCLDIRGVADAMTGIPEMSNASESELLHAAEQVLESDPPVKSQQITLTFLREDGQWKVLPNRALQALLSGFTAH